MAAKAKKKTLRVPRRSTAINRHRKAGGAVAAVFPGHYPRSLFRAFDILPVEVWGPPGVDTTAGDERLQAYVCSIVRCSLSFLLNGGLEQVDTLVVPHTCDSLQGFGSLLLDFHPPGKLVLPMYLPRGGRPASASFYVNELRAVYEKLAKATDKRPSNDELTACLDRETEADAELAKLLDGRRQIALSDHDFYRVVRAREYLPAEDFTKLASSVARDFEGPAPKGFPLLLSGLVPEPMSLFEVLSDAGGQVVCDDLLSSGRRRYPAGHGTDAFARMADRVLLAPPDSTRGSAVSDRVTHLVAAARSSGARAAIFFEVKFCEPEQFYLPQVRQALEDEGLRSIIVEVDLSEPLGHQAVTRVEALLETLS